MSASQYFASIITEILSRIKNLEALGTSGIIIDFEDKSILNFIRVNNVSEFEIVRCDELGIPLPQTRIGRALCLVLSIEPNSEGEVWFPIPSLETSTLLVGILIASLNIAATVLFKLTTDPVSSYIDLLSPGVEISQGTLYYFSLPIRITPQAGLVFFVVRIRNSSDSQKLNVAIPLFYAIRLERLGGFNNILLGWYPQGKLAVPSLPYKLTFPLILSPVERTLSANLTLVINSDSSSSYSGYVSISTTGRKIYSIPQTTGRYEIKERIFLLPYLECGDTNVLPGIEINLFGNGSVWIENLTIQVDSVVSPPCIDQPIELFAVIKGQQTVYRAPINSHIGGSTLLIWNMSSYGVYINCSINRETSLGSYIVPNTVTQLKISSRCTEVSIYSAHEATVRLKGLLSLCLGEIT